MKRIILFIIKAILGTLTALSLAIVYVMAFAWLGHTLAKLTGRANVQYFVENLGIWLLFAPICAFITWGVYQALGPLMAIIMGTTFLVVLWQGTFNSQHTKRQVVYDKDFGNSLNKMDWNARWNMRTSPDIEDDIDLADMSRVKLVEDDMIITMPTTEKDDNGDDSWIYDNRAHHNWVRDHKH